MRKFAPFKSNPCPSIGVEQEFHLVDPDTAELVPAVSSVMAQLDEGARQRTAYELKNCVLETQTPVCNTAAELDAAVRLGRKQVAEACSRAGVCMAAAGSHPFGDWRRQPYVSDPHYEWVRRETGYLSDRMLAFGLHIHVGMRSDESALHAMHEFRRWVYPMLALSANSPFFEGADTGLSSVRMHLFGAMPRTCLPPDIQTMNELEQIYGTLCETGDTTAPGDLWWIVRPQPPLGTVEVRVCDLPTRPERVAIFAAVVQAALAFYQDRFDEGTPRTALNPVYLEQNRWRAMRYGLECRVADPETAAVIPMRACLERLFDTIAGKAAALDSLEYIDAARSLLKAGDEARLQRDRHKALDGDLRALELEIADMSIPG